MNLGDQIRENRKKTGLTQEQIAKYLGVSTPAVNKWENGINYPDITLLPALARLLKIDLNTLFSFHKELATLEIKTFVQELIDTTHHDGIRIAFEMAKAKIHDYPHCDSLIYSVATVLDSCLVLSPEEDNDKRALQQLIITWYEQVSNREDSPLKTAATYMLIKKYIKNADYDIASNLMDQIQEIEIDKTTVQSELLIHQGKTDEAATLLEAKLLQALQRIQAYLYKLIDLEWQAEEHTKAIEISKIARDMVALFGLWHYGATVPSLQIALHQENVSQSIDYISEIIEASHRCWDMNTSPIFYRIAQELFENIGVSFESAFITELESSHEYDFLRTYPDFRSITEKYREQ